MKIFDILYWHYYKFYTRVLPDEQPNATTIFVFSFVISVLVNGIIDYFAIKYFCIDIGKWVMIGVYCLITYGSYKFFFSSRRYLKIIKERPVLFDNKKLSSIAVYVLTFLILSWLFFGAVIGKTLLESC